MYGCDAVQVVKSRAGWVESTRPTNVPVNRLQCGGTRGLVPPYAISKIPKRGEVELHRAFVHAHDTVENHSHTVGGRGGIHHECVSGVAPIRSDENDIARPAGCGTA